MPQLKICGLKEPANILDVVGVKPDYMGFIFYSKSDRFVDDLSPSFLLNLPSFIKKTGVFVNEDLDKVKEKINAFGLAAVQLHGNENAEYCNDIKKSGLEVIKAFGLDEQFNFNVLNDYISVVDYFLFDTQTPGHGGSGRAFDWTLLEKYKLNKSYFLSGGINIGHSEAINGIIDPRLYAIDINSKFEIFPGVKDLNKLNNFKKMLSK